MSQLTTSSGDWQDEDCGSPNGAVVRKRLRKTKHLVHHIFSFQEKEKRYGEHKSLHYGPVYSLPCMNIDLQL